MTTPVIASADHPSVGPFRVFNFSWENLKSNAGSIKEIFQMHSQHSVFNSTVLSLDDNSKTLSYSYSLLTFC